MNPYRFQFLPIELKNRIFRTIQNLKRVFSPNYFVDKGPEYHQYNLSRILGPKKKICYAPDKGMFFSKEGLVNPCCLNRNHIYGEIPKNSINEIWNGNKIHELRQLLNNSDLPESCSLCINRILCGNFDAVKARHYDEVSLKKKYPSMLEFELSNNCNLQCIMCSPEFSSSIKNEKGNNNFNYDFYDDSFVEQLEKYIPHLEKTEFLGGEPFYIPIYFKIWNKIIKLNPKCVILIQTNGTILNDKIKQLLSKGNFRISVSIDSFRKETYELIRRNSKFETVINNISYFSAHAKKNKYPLGISVCPIQQNWHELPEIITKCNQLNAFVHFNTVLSPRFCSLYYLPLAELNQIFKTLSLTDLPNKKRVEKKNKFHYECFLNQLNAWINEKTEKNKISEQKATWWKNNKERIEKHTFIELTNDIVSSLKSQIKEKQASANIQVSTVLSQKLSEIVDQIKELPYSKQLLVKICDLPSDSVYEVLKNENIKDIVTNLIIAHDELIEEIEFQD